MVVESVKRAPKTAAVPAEVAALVPDPVLGSLPVPPELSSES
jgi:hypothetical protein